MAELKNKVQNALDEVRMLVLAGEARKQKLNENEKVKQQIQFSQDNVLSNALEVSPDGGTITLGVEAAAEEVTLSVLDEGPGMTDAEKSRAFDRFWRGQGLTGRSGSGLGLSVVRHLLTDAGGTVTLRDAPGGGLWVMITLRASPRSGG